MKKTIADQLIAMGEKKGIEKGVELGALDTRCAIAENMLGSGFILKEVARFTKLSVDVLESMQVKALKKKTAN